MVREVFVDTSGWASFFVDAEASNRVATQLMKRWRSENVAIVTTNYVLAELGALLARPLRIPKAVQLNIIGTIRSAGYVEIVHVDASLDEETWRLWARRTDKEWSLVDCVSFVVMGRRQIIEALTSDSHFEQAGFRRLLASR